jgi:hypothetical protein
MSELFKGKTPWNKGLTKETDERVKINSEHLTGLHRSDEIRQKFREINIGKKLSEEHKKNIMGMRY